MCHRDCSLGELDYLILVSQFLLEKQQNITLLIQKFIQDTFSMQFFILQNELSVSVDVGK